MDILRKLLIGAVFAIVFLVGPSGDTYAQANANLKKVTVYFWEFNREGGGDDMIPFKRYVDKKAPLRPTIEALLAGPTKGENPDRFSSVAYGDLKLSLIEVRRGTARIDFTRTISADSNPAILKRCVSKARSFAQRSSFPRSGK